MGETCRAEVNKNEIVMFDANQIIFRYRMFRNCPTSRRSSLNLLVTVTSKVPVLSLTEHYVMKAYWGVTV
jgi:hypothetical protein